MRKNIHLTLAIGAIALLASCAQESIISREYDPDQIAYKAFANNATKSGAVDNDHLGNIGDLYVSAIKLNDAGYYFSNNVISSSDVSSSTANSGNTPYYWPAYKLGFYAANRPLTVTESSAAKLTPSIDNFTVSRSALNAPDELMVALEAQQRDGNGTPVQLGLHHALSRLTIQVQKTIPGYDISVAGVQIGGFKSVGTFTFPQYNTTNAASDAAWEGLVSANYGNANNLHTCWGSLSTPLQYGDLNISNDALSGTAMTSSAQNIMGGAYFYVIPQGVTLTTAASGSSPDITDHWIDLLVNVRSSASNVQIYPASADAGKYAVTRIYIPASQVFEAGKSYTVTLNFSNGIGVSESIQANGNIEEIYAGTLAKSTALSSSNLKKVVAPEFPDDTFILGSAIDYVASASEWVAGTYGQQNQGELVDLGLSVKWRGWNLGASKPEEYGEYYAWGETSPTSDYYWSTYKWCNGSSKDLTRYCTSTSYGTVDNKTSFEDYGYADDAARAILGGNWRTPTDAEWTELRNNCTWTWTSNYNGTGVTGMIVTSNVAGYTDKSIFLPAAGRWSGTDFYELGTGYYWSSSLNASTPCYAWYLLFESGNFYRRGNTRFHGMSVRPVTE